MQILKTYILRFITLVVALQLLNLSIYAQDFRPLFLEEDKAVTNITESFTEFLIEDVLGHTQAIPEQRPHHHDMHFHKHISFKALNQFTTFSLPDLQKSSHLPLIPTEETYQCLFLLEITPPPPKA